MENRNNANSLARSAPVPPPPPGLSDEAQRLWRQLIEDFSIDDSAGLLLLKTALESYDELREAKAILERDGPVISDRFGQKRQHPATLVARDARNSMLKALKALNLDIEPPLTKRMK